MNLVIAGDFCPNDRFLTGRANLNDSVSQEIVEIFKSSSFSILNFESPILLKSESFHKILKQGPHLLNDRYSLEYVKSIGIDAITLANNHIKDYGSQGVIDTINISNEVGLEYVGVGADISDANKFLLKKIDGKSIAIVNCCENEFSIATSSSYGSNPIDPVRQYYSIKKAKEISDYVVVIVHGGIEHFQLPTLRMKQIYRFFIDAGADAVVNHHQHCFSGYEIYNHKPIFYGLGNFMFDWNGKRNGIWNEGYLLNLQFEANEIKFDIIPYTQCNDKPTVCLMSEIQNNIFSAKIEELNDIIQDDIRLNAELNSFMDRTEADYLLALSPYSSRYPVALFRRGLLPSFLSKKRILRIYDYLKCESHRDRLIHFIEKKYNKL